VADYKDVNINDCIESTLNIVRNELKYKVKVLKEYGDIPRVKCYPRQLSQVFMNLLINASHAIEKQGEIVIKTWSENSSVCVSISDNGSGIEEEHLNKIFDPFFTTKEAGKGTGLGLSISYDIIKNIMEKLLFTVNRGKALFLQ
jgi:two-component system NtrC family sensor kinase